MLVQQKLEEESQQVKFDYRAVAEEASRKEGWDSLAQQEYFSNIEQFEDLSFVGEAPRPRLAEMTEIIEPTETSHSRAGNVAEYVA